MNIREIEFSVNREKSDNIKDEWAGVQNEKGVTRISFCLDSYLAARFSSLEVGNDEVDYRAEFVTGSGFKYTTDSLTRGDEYIVADLPYEVSHEGGRAQVFLSVSVINGDRVDAVFRSEPQYIYFSPDKQSEAGIREEAQTVSLAIKLCRDSMAEIGALLSEIEEDKEACEQARNTVSADKNTVLGYKNSADASRDAAAVSETNAKASEDNAKLSEDNAKVSEDNAKLSEDNAKLSEDNAKVSEDNAKLSENAAKSWYDRTAALNIPTKTSDLQNDGDSSGKRFLTTDTADSEVVTYDSGTSLYALKHKRYFLSSFNDTVPYTNSAALIQGITGAPADFKISLSFTASMASGIMLTYTGGSEILVSSVYGGEYEFNLSNIPAGQFTLYAVAMEGPSDASVSAENVEVNISEKYGVELFSSSDKTKLNNAASTEYVNNRTADWRVIKNVTVYNQDGRYAVNTDSDGNEFSLKEFFIHIQLAESGEGLNCQIRANGGSPYLHYETIGVNGKNLYLKGEKCVDRWITATTGFVNKTVDNGSGIYNWKTNYDAREANTITAFDFTVGRNTLPDATVITVYGKDA